MTDILGILFDKDGTLFDFNKTWSSWTNSLLMELAGGDTVRAGELGTVIGYDTVHQTFAPDSVVIAATPDDIARDLEPHLPGHTMASLFALLNKSACEAPQFQTADLVPLLSGLRQAGMKLGIATNDAEMPTFAHLQSSGIRDQFDFVAGFDSGFGAKPEPGMLLGFADAVGLAPAQVVMVGDSRHDLEAGRAAGMMTIGVLTGPARAEDLAPLADHVLPDISHLPQCLDLRLVLPTAT